MVARISVGKIVIVISKTMAVPYAWSLTSLRTMETANLHQLGTPRVVLLVVVVMPAVVRTMETFQVVSST